MHAPWKHKHIAAIKSTSTNIKVKIQQNLSRTANQLQDNLYPPMQPLWVQHDHLQVPYHKERHTIGKILLVCGGDVFDLFIHEVRTEAVHVHVNIWWLPLIHLIDVRCIGVFWRDLRGKEGTKDHPSRNEDIVPVEAGQDTVSHDTPMYSEHIWGGPNVNCIDSLCVKDGVSGKRIQRSTRYLDGEGIAPSIIADRHMARNNHRNILNPNKPKHPGLILWHRQAQLPRDWIKVVMPTTSLQPPHMPSCRFPSCPHSLQHPSTNKLVNICVQPMYVYDLYSAVRTFKITCGQNSEWLNFEWATTKLSTKIHLHKVILGATNSEWCLGTLFVCTLSYYNA